MKKYCECGNEGITLLEISKLNIKVFGRIPIKDVVNEWYKRGYEETDIVCEECIQK